MKSEARARPTPTAADATLQAQLATLQLLHLREHYEALAAEAARRQISHVDYLAELIEGEVHRREQRSLQRRIRAARLPVLKTLDGFDWGWPRKINREQVHNPLKSVEKGQVFNFKSRKTGSDPQCRGLPRLATPE